MERMPFSKEHMHFIWDNRRALDPFSGMKYEPNINDAGADPLVHFLYCTFKEHHFDIRILLLKMGKHACE